MGGKTQHARVVGDNDDGAPAAVQIRQLLHDAVAAGGIQVSGGLIRQDDGRVIDQCARNGNALLLTAG